MDDAEHTVFVCRLSPGARRVSEHSERMSRWEPMAGFRNLVHTRVFRGCSANPGCQSELQGLFLVSGDRPFQPDGTTMLSCSTTSSLAAMRRRSRHTRSSPSARRTWPAWRSKVNDQPGSMS